MQKTAWWFFLFISVYLVIAGLWRLTVEAHEFAMPGAVWMRFLLDLGLIAVLFGFFKQLRDHLPLGDARRGYITPLFAAALISGILMLLIRLSSDHGWWTGHLRYNCCP